MDKVYVITGVDHLDGEKRVLTVCRTADEAKRAVGYYNQYYDYCDYEEFFFETFNELNQFYRGSFNMVLSPTDEPDTYYMQDILSNVSDDYTKEPIKNDFGFNLYTSQSTSFPKKVTRLSGNFISLAPPPSDRHEIHKFLRDKINEKGIIKVLLPEF